MVVAQISRDSVSRAPPPRLGQGQTGPRFCAHEQFQFYGYLSPPDHDTAVMLGGLPLDRLSLVLERLLAPPLFAY